MFKPTHWIVNTPNLKNKIKNNCKNTNYYKKLKKILLSGEGALPPANARNSYDFFG